MENHIKKYCRVQLAYAQTNAALLRTNDSRLKLAGRPEARVQGERF
jgi:hypothetical protein